MDLPLSDEGREQATKAAEYLASRYRPDVVYTSPLQRCRDSAAALTGRVGLPAPLVEPGFTDTDYGLWQGRLATEVAQEEPVLHAQWRETPDRVRFPHGESLADVAARATAGLSTLVSRHEGKTIVAYSHDSVLRVLLLSTMGAPLGAYHRLEIDPCSLSELHCEPALIRIVRINERTD